MDEETLLIIIIPLAFCLVSFFISLIFHSFLKYFQVKKDNFKYALIISGLSFITFIILYYASFPGFFGRTFILIYLILFIEILFVKYVCKENWKKSIKLGIIFHIINIVIYGFFYFLALLLLIGLYMA